MKSGGAGFGPAAFFMPEMDASRRQPPGRSAGHRAASLYASPARETHAIPLQGQMQVRFLPVRLASYSA